MDKELLNLTITLSVGVVLLIIVAFSFYRIYRSYKQRVNKVDFKLPELVEEKEENIRASKNATKISVVNKKKYPKDKVFDGVSSNENNLYEEYQNQINNKKTLNLVDLPDFSEVDDELENFNEEFEREMSSFNEEPIEEDWNEVLGELENEEK